MYLFFSSHRLSHSKFLCFSLNCTFNISTCSFSPKQYWRQWDITMLEWEKPLRIVYWQNPYQPLVENKGNWSHQPNWVQHELMTKARLHPTLWLGSLLSNIHNLKYFSYLIGYQLKQLLHLNRNFKRKKKSWMNLENELQACLSFVQFQLQCHDLKQEAWKKCLTIIFPL